MTLPSLPADWAPDDTPSAAELNAVKAHAGYHVDRYTTVLRRGTLVQAIAHNAFVPVSWQTVVGARNGLGWAVGTPTRIPCPAGAGGRYEIIFTGELANAAGGFRYSALAKNNTLIKPGLFCPGDATLTSWLATAWETEMAAGDYLEIWLYQNKTTVGTLNLNVTGESPEVTVRRKEQ